MADSPAGRPLPDPPVPEPRSAPDALDAADLDDVDVDPVPLDPLARLTYEGSGLADAAEGERPLTVVRRWLADAVADERIVEPGAMVVATVDADGRPNARTVLLKGLDARGFTFYTGLGSAKAHELAANPTASLVLLWHPMYRQVRARGVVEQVSREQSRAYFQSRPRDSQVAAWASAQSSPLGSRAELQAAVERVEQQFAGQDPLPLPDFWGGYLVRPFEVELWVGQRSRLHDRLVWTSRDGRPAPLDGVTRWHVSRRQP